MPQDQLQTALIPRIWRTRKPINEKIYRSVTGRLVFRDDSRYSGHRTNRTHHHQPPVQSGVPWHMWTRRWQPNLGRWETLPWRLPQRQPAPAAAAADDNNNNILQEIL